MGGGEGKVVHLSLVWGTDPAGEQSRQPPVAAAQASTKSSKGRTSDVERREGKEGRGKEGRMLIRVISCLKGREYTDEEDRDEETGQRVRGQGGRN